MKREHGLRAIRQRRLKIARLAQLNDPFEFLPFSLRTRADRAGFERWRGAMDIDHGLLCFSSKATNPVLWSHYAENHRGVCLAFDVPDHLLLEVQYVSKRGRIDVDAFIGSDGEAGECLIRRALATKYTHWRYENEWRVFISLDHEAREGDLYFADFGPEIRLRQVIVGPKSTITREEVADALGDLQGVEAYKARLAFQSFTVVKNRDQKLWT